MALGVSGRFSTFITRNKEEHTERPTILSLFDCYSINTLYEKNGLKFVITFRTFNINVKLYKKLKLFAKHRQKAL